MQLAIRTSLPGLFVALALGACAHAPSLDPKIERDPAALQTACTGGVGVACSQLALMHLNAWIVPTKDVPRALGYYERACQLKDPKGCVNLGIIYRNGKETTADVAKGDALLSRACELGDCYWKEEYAKKAEAARIAAGGKPAPPKKSGGFLKGAMAGLGTYAVAKSVGVSTEDAINTGAAVAGAVSPDSKESITAAQQGLAYVQTANALVASTKAASASGAASGGSSAKSAGGAAQNLGPEKPNMAEGACGKYMNMSNYRTNALIKDDVQLRTQCGMAYEYYKAYRNARAQGYGPADVARTYAAHSGAAKVAIQVSQMH